MKKKILASILIAAALVVTPLITSGTLMAYSDNDTVVEETENTESVAEDTQETEVVTDETQTTDPAVEETQNTETETQVVEVNVDALDDGAVDETEGTETTMVPQGEPAEVEAKIPVTVHITGCEATTQYSGDVQSFPGINGGAKFVNISVEGGDADFNPSYIGMTGFVSGTHVGDYVGKLTDKNFYIVRQGKDSSGKTVNIAAEYAKKYDITFDFDESKQPVLHIVPMPITVKSASAKAPYSDGASLSAPRVEIISPLGGGMLPAGEGYQVKTYTKLDSPGTVPNEVHIVLGRPGVENPGILENEVFDEETGKTYKISDNYDITYEWGTLTLTEAADDDDSDSDDSNSDDGDSTDGADDSDAAGGDTEGTSGDNAGNGSGSGGSKGGSNSNNGASTVVVEGETDTYISDGTGYSVSSLQSTATPLAPAEEQGIAWQKMLIPFGVAAIAVLLGIVAVVRRFRTN